MKLNKIIALFKKDW